MHTWTKRDIGAQKVVENAIFEFSASAQVFPASISTNISINVYYF